MLNKIIQEDIENIIKEPLNWDELQGTTVLISGAAGFIPSYIVEVILFLNETRFKNKTKILALVRDIKRAQKKFEHHKASKDLIFIKQDISVPFDISEKIDYIIHAASQASPKYYGIDPVGTLNANVLGTSYLLELARKNKIRKFIFFSSGAVYGTHDDTTLNIDETYTGRVDITHLGSCYDESKRMGENMCICYSHQYGCNVNMLRLSHTYGPGVNLDDGRVFGDFVRDIINNRNIILNSDGSAKRSFCYISDMVIAFFMILFKGENKQAYNIASKEETSILELAKVLIGLYPQKNLNVEFAKGVFIEGYIRSTSSRASYNINKIEALGWKQKINLKTGFKRMIESYKD
jgi:UDP-glucuronate decarboxylase